MKAKILLIPLFVCIILATIIWFIKPTWSDGQSGVKEKREELQKEQEKLSTIENKINNVEKLRNSLVTNPNWQKTITNYLPDVLEEENLMNGINSLASSEGLVVSDLSVKSSKKNKENTTVRTNLRGEKISEEEQKTDARKPKEVYYEIALAAYGDYPQIKATLDKIARLERFNKFISLEVKRPERQGLSGSMSMPEGKIIIDSTISFSYSPKVTTLIDAEYPIFSQTSFDVNVAEEVAKLRSMEIWKIEINQSGRENPFKLP